jgi:hypothetical protein
LQKLPALCNTKLFVRGYFHFEFSYGVSKEDFMESTSRRFNHAANLLRTGLITGALACTVNLAAAQVVDFIDEAPCGFVP